MRQYAWLDFYGGKWLLLIGRMIQYGVMPNAILTLVLALHVFV